MAIAIVAIVLVSGFAASRQNELSLNSQKTIARYETDNTFDRLHVTLLQMTYWQDAYERIGRHWDQKWIAYQFGPYLDASAIHLVAIFGPEGQLRYLYTGGSDTRLSKESLAKAEGLTTLLEVVHAVPARQPPRLREGIVTIAGAPYFASAGIVTPENAADFPLAHERQFTTVFFRPVTIADYNALSNGFGATKMRISRNGNAPAGLAAFALSDVAGKSLAWLQWKPQQPGVDFLKAIIPPMIVVFLLLALVQGTVVRRWQILQRELFTAEAKATAAQEESHTKSVFLGTISDELRTPLNAIIGFSDVLLNRMFGPLGSERYEEYAGHIRESGHALLKIVNDLIEIARIEARDTAIECECIDAAHAVRLAIGIVGERAAARKITPVFDAVEGNVWCEGSPQGLCHAIERVLDNAIRHSKEGASVMVSARRHESEAVVEVRDSGDGGDGLELSIAKGLMRLMKGSLSITSEESVGTTVALHLPAAEAPREFKKKAA